MTMTTTEAPAVKVGDFFSCSWGYDETHIDFYKVIALTPSGKSVKVQQWTKSFAPGSGGPCDYVVPGNEPATVRVWNDDYSDQIVTEAPIQTKRLSKAGWSVPAFTVNSFSVATLWDGKPEYQTGRGYGR